MREIIDFLLLACGVTFATGLLGFDDQANSKYPQWDNAGYCYDSTNHPVSVGHQYRLDCYVCICGPYGRPIQCSARLCYQLRARTVSRTSVNQPSKFQVPVKTPNKAPLPLKIPIKPHVPLKTPHQPPILPKFPHETLAVKSLAKPFKHVEPSITAVAAAKGKAPKRSKYA